MKAIDICNLQKADLIRKVGPLFTADQKKTGVLASVSMAQFILESAYAGSELARNANNCFGMKTSLSGNTWPGSTWNGTSYKKYTKEQRADGTYKTITAAFRSYPSIEKSIEDHSAYLLGAMNGKKKRYAGLKGEKSYRKALQIIKDGGYATSLKYVDNLCRVIEDWNLTQYDYKEETSVGYKLIKKYAHSSNRGGTRALSSIKYLVYHYTANDGDRAANNAAYFQSQNRNASAHYFVDDSYVYKSVIQGRIAWSVGDGKGKYGITNANSVSIEMCDTVKDGKYNLSAKTQSNAVALGRSIVKSKNIPQSKVVRHYDASRKRCPAYFCGSSSKDDEWKKFRAQIYAGFQIGKSYELKQDLAVRKTCGGKKNSEKLKKGSKVKVVDAKYYKPTGSLYIKIGDSKWILAVKDGHKYLK